MSKFLSVLAAAAVVVSGSAAAQTLSPAPSTQVLEGSAGLGGLNCLLRLTVGVNGQTGTILGGTNDLALSDPGCAGVRVDAAGTYSLTLGSYSASGGAYGSGGASGHVNGLQVSVYNASLASWVACPTATIPITLSTVAPLVTEVTLVGTVPGCGPVYANLYGNVDLLP